MCTRFGGWSFFFAGLAIWATTCPIELARGAQVPISVTGFDQSMVVAAGETFLGGALTATMDGGTGSFVSTSTWYGVGQNTSAPTTGLPIGVVTSMGDPTTTLEFAPFGSGNVPSDDAILIDSTNTTGAFTLSSPADYGSLALIAATATTSTTNVIGYTLMFSDGSTQTGSLTVNNWFTSGETVAYGAGGRLTQYQDINVGAPGEVPWVYELSIPVTPTTALLDKVNFAYSSGAGHTAIFALSGAIAVPEPSSAILMGLGGLGLCAQWMMRRRHKHRHEV
jgi:hypothetical protein